MILPAYVMDFETGETLGVFGYEVDPLDRDWQPERWCRVRRYTVPASGPGGHGWGAWSIALLILLAVYGVIAYGVWR